MSDSEKYILAIDHGTGGPKTAIVSTHGDVIDWAFQEVPLLAEKGGGVEQDPNDWWNAILKTAKQVINSGKVSVDDIVGVCNSSQWSGTVALDKEGNHLMNAIIWMDTRGAPYVKKLHKSLIQISGYSMRKALKYVKITGAAPTLSGKDPLGHILWMRDKRPEIYDETYMFLEPQDYVNMRFTGIFAASYASIQMHFMTDIRDINNIKYYNQIMKWVKLDPEKFPKDLRWSTDILGPIKDDIADQIGLKRGTKMVMGAPDLQTATVGSGAIRDYEGHIYIGTSDWLLCHVPHKKTDIFHGIASFPAAIKGKYFSVNEQEIAGGALQFLRDKILYHKDELLKEEKVPDVYKILDRIVETVPAGSNNLIFTPWLIGERAPVDDHTVRGGFYNLSLEMSRAHLIRAIFEGVAYNVRWLLMYVEKFIKKWKLKESPGMKKNDFIMPELNIIGGGASSNIWCQIFADVLNRTIKQVKDPIQANARGAAFIAAVGLGYLTWDQIPDLIQFSNTFKPNPENREVYDKLFNEFTNIYKIMRKTHKRLNS
jgi:xylulokinase